MAFPQESTSGDIDLFCIDHSPSVLPILSWPRVACIDLPARPHRYHSMQLALIIGIFAVGGLICSLLLVESNDDFPRRHHWPRKSDNAPMMALQPPATPSTTRSESLGMSGEDKTTVLQQRR